MIRKGTIKDLETIVEYNYNLAKETEGLELSIKALTDGVAAVLSDEKKGTYFVYEKNGQVVGQMMITKEWSDWRNGEFWWIQSVYVSKKYRRQGIFKKLFNHVMGLAQRNKYVCGLRLYVERENRTAIDTYKSLGFNETPYRMYEISGS